MRDYGEVGRGWLGLIRKLEGELRSVGWNGEVEDVKEKFGGLRFYISYNDGLDITSAEAYISRAASDSLKVCEACGSPGTPARKRGWIKTLCSSCRNSALWEETGSHRCQRG